MKNLKRLIGPALDKVGQAEAELAAAERELGEVRAAIARHQAEARRLATDWLHAATQDVAEQFDRQRREALRLVEGDNARIPALEARLVAAKAEKHRHLLQRHRSAIAACVPDLIEAVERAADVQCQAIKLRDAAVRDLGEGVVAATIPHVAFAGLLLPDLVAMWASELKRSYDPPAPQRPQPVSPQPATAPRRANGQVNAGLGEVTAAPAVPPKPLRREPRSDPPPTEADCKAVVFMRGGAELPDGSPAVAGDQVNLPAAQAHALVMRGLADYAKGSAA